MNIKNIKFETFLLSVCVEAVNREEIVKSDFVFWNFKMLKQSRVMNECLLKFLKIFQILSFIH